MANVRGKEIDNTHLSIEQAEARGFIHRDYIAHCLRWTHVAKYLHLQARYKSARIIDIGCGKDMPLVRMLYTSRLAPSKYLGIEYNKMEIPDMFKNSSFKPDLILVSVVESTWFLAIDLLGSVPEKDRNYKTLLGGVFPTYASEKVIKNKYVDYVCRGEGEEPIMEMCERLISSGRIDNVKNFTIKADGQIYRNNLRPGMDLDKVPIPDWDLFDSGSLYRPMQGKIYRTVGVETQRGCPYTCTFCNSPGNNVIYKFVNDTFGIHSAIANND